jgi:hypothetical protein
MNLSCTALSLDSASSNLDVFQLLRSLERLQLIQLVQQVVVISSVGGINEELVFFFLVSTEVIEFLLDFLNLINIHLLSQGLLCFLGSVKSLENFVC